MEHLYVEDKAARSSDVRTLAAEQVPSGATVHGVRLKVGIGYTVDYTVDDTWESEGGALDASEVYDQDEPDRHGDSSGDPDQPDGSGEGSAEG